MVISLRAQVHGRDLAESSCGCRRGWACGRSSGRSATASSWRVRRSSWSAAAPRRRSGRGSASGRPCRRSSPGRRSPGRRPGRGRCSAAAIGSRAGAGVSSAPIVNARGLASVSSWKDRGVRECSRQYVPLETDLQRSRNEGSGGPILVACWVWTITRTSPRWLAESRSTRFPGFPAGSCSWSGRWSCADKLAARSRPDSAG